MNKRSYGSLKNILKIVLWRFAPPDSGLRLFFKNLVDQVKFHDVLLNRQIRQASASYTAWVRLRETSHTEFGDLALNPAVSFLVFSTDIDAIKDLIRSLQGQQYQNWQLVVGIANDQIGQMATPERRVKFVESAEKNYLSLLVHASGDFFVCIRENDRFPSRFLHKCVEKIIEYPDAQIIYTDSDEILDNEYEGKPFFKPDAWSPEMLLSVNYLSRALVRRDLGLAIRSWISTDNDLDTHEWEILLHASFSAHRIIHIADVLVHQVATRPDKESAIETGHMIENYLKRLGLDQPVALKTADGWHAGWNTPRPLVSIIIPNKNNFEVLKKCLDSIFTLTEYPNYELLIVDNASADKDVVAFYQELQARENVRILNYGETFNYSRANNQGASAAKGDLFLFLNNDVEVLSKNWLDELVYWALRPEIGVVGAKLLYPDGHIQHAGVVLGLQGFVDHLYLNVPDAYYGLMGSVNWYRNVSAVTGACQMMRRTVFVELGGYDENFQLIFSDVEICLRASQNQYRIVYTPFAQLLHHHGLTRGKNDPAGDLIKGFEYLLSSFDGNDPFFSPALTYTYIPSCQLGGETAQDRIDYMREKFTALTRWNTE